jgi:hypothetical protein
MKYKPKYIPKDVFTKATALNNAWVIAAHINPDLKNIHLKAYIGGGASWRLIQDAVSHTVPDKDAVAPKITDIDWYIDGRTKEDQKLLSEKREIFGKYLLDQCSGAEWVPAPRDSKTKNLLYYQFKWLGDEINMGLPKAYSNFTFLIDPISRTIITHPDIPSHEEDIELFYEKGLIKSYNLDKMILKSYEDPIQRNILAFILKSYFKPLQEFNKSFETETAKILHGLFTDHPLIAKQIRERLVTYYYNKLNKFSSENEIDLYLETLKKKVRILSGDLDPTSTEQIIALQEQKDQLAIKLAEAKAMSQAFEKCYHEAIKKSEVQQKIITELRAQLKVANAQREIQAPKPPEPISPQVEPPIATESPSEKTPQTRGFSDLTKPELLALLLGCIALNKNLNMQTVHLSYDYELKKCYDTNLANGDESARALFSQASNLFEDIDTEEKFARMVLYFTYLVTLLQTSRDSINIPKELSYYETVFILIDNVSLYDLIKKKASTPEAKNRFETLGQIIKKSHHLITLILPNSDLAKPLEEFSAHIENTENKSKLITQMHHMDTIFFILLKHHAVISGLSTKLMHLNVSTNLSQLTTISDEFNKATEEADQGTVSRAINRYQCLHKSINADELTMKLNFIKVLGWSIKTFGEWMKPINTYCAERSNFKGSQKELEALKAVRSAYQTLTEEFEEKVKCSRHHGHFSNFEKRRGLTSSQYKIPRADDLLHTCVTPLLDPALHKKLRGKTAEIIQGHCPELKKKVLSHLRQHNPFCLEKEFLDDEEALLEEHEMFLGCYKDLALANPPSDCDICPRVFELLKTGLKTKRENKNTEAGPSTDTPRSQAKKLR